MAVHVSDGEPEISIESLSHGDYEFGFEQEEVQIQAAFGLPLVLVIVYLKLSGNTEMKAIKSAAFAGSSFWERRSAEIRR